MVDKKIVATTVSSREVGLERRSETVTTSSHGKKINNNNKPRETEKIHFSLISKDSKKVYFVGIKEDTTTKVLQKNTRSMNSSERLQELFNEVHHVAWDVILTSETWRQGKEMWELKQGHIMVEPGKFTNKHGVALLLNKRWKKLINWVQCPCERVVAMSIPANNRVDECVHAPQWLPGSPS